MTVFANDSDRLRPVRQRLEDVLRAHGLQPASPPARPDLVICLGGDGTFLTAVHRYLDHDPAFLGINAGHLGFLQEADPDELDQVAARLAGGRYQEERVPLLEVEVTGTDAARKAWALNDVVVERRDTRTLRLGLELDGQALGPLVGDGVLVATPLGSTAYAYAAGGAVVHPACPVLQVVPVNPHRSRQARALAAPLVLPAGTTVTVTVDWSRARTPRLVVDGEEMPLMAPERVAVRLGPRTARIVRFGTIAYWERVRSKLT